MKVRPGTKNGKEVFFVAVRGGDLQFESEEQARDFVALLEGVVSKWSDSAKSARLWAESGHDQGDTQIFDVTTWLVYLAALVVASKTIELAHIVIVKKILAAMEQQAERSGQADDSKNKKPLVKKKTTGWNM